MNVTDNHFVSDFFCLNQESSRFKIAAVNALQRALRKCRIPQVIYVDNAKQFVSKLFKAEAKKTRYQIIVKNLESMRT